MKHNVNASSQKDSGRFDSGAADASNARCRSTSAMAPGRSSPSSSIVPRYAASINAATRSVSGTCIDRKAKP